MDLVLNTISLTGLVLLMGSPAFYGLVWSSTEDIPVVKHRLRLLLTTGSLLYLFSLLLPGLLDYFLSSSKPVSLNYLNLLVVPLYMACFHRLVNVQDRKTGICMLVIALTLLILHTLPAEIADSRGVLPFFSHFIHLAAVSIWGGCTLIFLTLPWSKIMSGKHEYSIDISSLILRYTVLTVSLLTLSLLTGAILSVANVHSMDVISNTAYGRILEVKLVAASLLFIFILIEFTRRPLASRSRNKQNGTGSLSLLKTYQKPALFNGLMILVIFGISIILADNTPPDTPPFLNPQTWHMNAGDYPVSIDMQPVAGSTTRIRFEIFVPDDLMSAQGTLVNYDLYLDGTDIGIFGGRALQASQNSFLGESSIPAPGTWNLDLRIDRPGTEALLGSMNIIIPSLPLISDLKTYLSFSAITYSRAKALTFSIGMLLVVVYLWLCWRSQQGRMSARYTVLGVTGAVLGMYLLMSVVLVKTYPSTYWNNPQPYTAEVINNGMTAYIAECAECHGDTGLGDGPWAVENRGAIPPLSSPHIDVHTDGEIYWWITHGIPSLDMPPLHDELSEDQRWQIIQFVRSLRHGIP